MLREMGHWLFYWDIKGERETEMWNSKGRLFKAGETASAKVPKQKGAGLSECQ